MSDKDLATLLLLNEAHLFKADREELETLEEEDGRNFQETVTQAKSLLSGLVKDTKKERLLAAKEALKESRSKVSEIKSLVAKSFDDKKKYLLEVLGNFPEIQGGLTFQNRDLNGLTEDDVDLALEQLKKLGVLDKFDNRDE